MYLVPRLENGAKKTRNTRNITNKHGINDTPLNLQTIILYSTARGRQQLSNYLLKNILGKLQLPEPMVELEIPLFYKNRFFIRQNFGGIKYFCGWQTNIFGGKSYL